MTTKHYVKADIKNIFKLLKDNLYSDEGTFLRELIQNAGDSLTERGKVGPGREPAIQIRLSPARGVFEIQDNGIGMSREELIERLACLGGSGKNGESIDTIGQFGIGFFSALNVASRVDVVSRRENEEATRLSMEPSGEYTMETYAPCETGTTVMVFLEQEYMEYAERSYVIQQVQKWADFLPYPIYLDAEPYPVNKMEAPFHIPGWQYHQAELKTWLQERFREEIISLIPVDDEGMHGALFITCLNGSMFSKPGRVSIWLKRMFIGDDAGLIPDWASPMVRGVLEFDRLTPTASRESLIRNAEYYKTANKINALLLEHLVHLAKTNPTVFRIIAICHDLTLKDAALRDEYLFEHIASQLLFQSNSGMISLEQVVTEQPKDQSGRTPILGYRNQADQLRFEQLYTPKGDFVLNLDAGLNAEVVDMYCRLHPEQVVFREVGADDGIYMPLPEEEAMRFKNLERTFAAVLRQRGVDMVVETRRFKPVRLSIALVDNSKAPGLSTDAWTGLIGMQALLMKHLAQSQKQGIKKLFLNAMNPVIRQLAVLDLSDGWLDDIVFNLFSEALLLSPDKLTDEQRKAIYDDHHQVYSALIQSTLENLYLKRELRKYESNKETKDDPDC